MKNKVLDILRKVNQIQESQFTLSRTSVALINKESEEAAKLAAEEVKYISKTENDLLNLIRRSEPFENDQITELLTQAELTSL